RCQPNEWRQHDVAGAADQQGLVYGNVRGHGDSGHLAILHRVLDQVEVLAHEVRMTRRDASVKLASETGVALRTGEHKRLDRTGVVRGHGRVDLDAQHELAVATVAADGKTADHNWFPL